MKKILVVEDDDSNREYMKVVLEKRGYMVVAAACGQDAIAFARQEAPDLAIIDMNLPDISGTQVAAALAGSGIPYFFLTAMLTSDEEEQLHNTLGGNFFMTKPCNTARLLEEVAKRAR